MKDLRPVDGWEHIMRGLAGELVLLEEESEGVTLTKSADIVFRDFYEEGLDTEDIADEGVSEEQVEEVIEYAEEDTENMHELARSSHDMKGLIEEASGGEVEDIIDRTLDEGEEDNVEYVDYSGPVGELQDMIEEQVEERGFKIRYNPDEDEQHRSVLEMHVVADSEAEHEAYFGANGQVFYVGSTVSDADKEFTDPEEAKHIIRQELNSLVYNRD